MMDTQAEEADHALADIIHRQLEHEDGLMVNRLSWLVASQSFLFTAYAIVLNSVPQAQSTATTPRQELLRNLLPVLGLTTSGLIYLGVLAGMCVCTALRRLLREHRGRGAAIGGVILGTATTYSLGLAAPLLLPPLFFVAWTTLLLWSP